MLDKFRKIIHGWMGKVLITFLLLPFALFGVSSIFQVNPNKNTVVEINGVEIDERELLRAVEISKQNLISRLGEQASSFVTNEMVRPAALDSLISQELMRQSAEENGLNVSMDKIHQMIMGMEAFHLDGKFSQSHFEELLLRNGLRPEAFPQKMRDEFLQRQMSSGYQASSFSTVSEIKQLKDLQNQTRSFSFIKLQLDKALEQVDLSDTEVQAYYDENRETFRTEELLTIDYLTIKKSDYTENLAISEEEIQQGYDEKITQMKESQERSASHILIEINEKTNKAEAKNRIDSLFVELEGGADFASLAREYSDDKSSAEKGGFLGFAGRGVYVDEFEDTLFSLNADEISKPILTEFGYHIIKLDGVQPELQSLASMRSELIEEIKVANAEQPYQDALEELRGLAYESSDLQEPAAFLGKNVQTSNKISRSPGSNEALLAESVVIDAAFSSEVLEKGNNSDVIELDDEQALVLRLKEHFPSKIKPLEEVRPQITAKLTEDLIKKKIKSLADEIVSSLLEGVSKEEVATLHELEWTEVNNIKRDEATIPSEIVSEIFKQPKPAANESFTSTFMLGNGEHVVSILFDVGSSDESELSSAESGASDLQLDRLLVGQKGALELQAYQSWLKREAKIKEL